MNVLPPWKLAEREEWAEARPWLAGLYFGLLMWLFFAVYPMIIGGTEQPYLAAIVGLASWPLFAVGVKLRWGQRPNAKAHPPPTYRRMWSRMSDASLLWFMWTGIAVVIFTPFFLLTGAVGTADGLIRLIPACTSRSVLGWNAGVGGDPTSLLSHGRTLTPRTADAGGRADRQRRRI